MRVERVPAPYSFDKALRAAILAEKMKGGRGLYVLFYGTEEATTGRSWCPDCVVADPLIRESLARRGDAVLLECPVGSREEWRISEPVHPYRTHPEIKLEAIPTLIRWTENGPERRLVEAECADRERLARFVDHTA